MPDIKPRPAHHVLDGNRDNSALAFDLNPMPGPRILPLNILIMGRAVVRRHLSIYMTSTLLDGIILQIPSSASHLTSDAMTL